MDPKDYQNSIAGHPVRTPQGYWTFVPSPLPPTLEWPVSLVGALSSADRALSRLSTLAGTFPFPHVLMQPFVRREAVQSSRIEGTRASLVELYTYESGQLSFLEPASDASEVYNYVRALDYGLDRRKDLPVSLRLIREMHSRLMEKARGSNLTPGEFRRSQNWIGPAGSTLVTAPYVPPPVDEMNQALADLETFIHSPSPIPHLVRIGLIHYQFEAIHPFLDGNGRMGRLLIMLLMCEWGILSQPILNLSSYIEQHRQVYYDRLLAVSQRGDWESWLEFFLSGIQVQAQEDTIRLVALNDLRLQYHREVRSERMVRLVDLLFERPIVSIRQVEVALGVPYLTAQRQVEKLVEAGVIREVTGRPRNRFYQADAILKAIEAPAAELETPSDQADTKK
jgi:Fic family protein